MDSLKHLAHGVFKRAAEAVTGPLKNSQFDEKGVLTPQEFVAAGDYLVRACPTWAWEAGDAKKSKSYLPPDKQFLVTRNVPCMKRASELEQYNPNSEFALAGEEEGWVATHSAPKHESEATASGSDSTAQPANAAGPDIAAAAGLGHAAGSGGQAAQTKAQHDDNIPDISELELGADDDEAALPPALGNAYLQAEEPDGNIVRTRTYDLYITYDQYYQVPRLWMVGYDESRRPLTPKQVLEDVSEEHARKTITVDPHPHLPINAASIHPCHHAEVMKRLVDNLQAAGKEFTINHYLVLFLKFIASVVPTIEYDYTMSVGN